MDIVVVGPCGSGKSTLVATLQEAGFDARAVAQEHSRIPELWRHAGDPDALIFLDASPPTITARRHNEFPGWLYEKQQRRLASARANATLYLQTDALSADDVERRALAHLGASSPTGAEPAG